MMQLLKHRNFAPLWWGGLISLMGNRVLTVALSFYVYEQTSSTIATAITVLATIVPSLVLSSIAGVFIDRWNRKLVLVISNLLMALSLLPLLAVNVTGWIWLVYLAAALKSSVATFFRTTENALLPQLVSEEKLVPANALNALNDTLARLMGPALGGVLLALGSLEAVVIVDCLSYLVAGSLALLLHIPRQEGGLNRGVGAKEGAWFRFSREWREGITTIVHSHVLTVLLLVMGITTFGGTMMDPLFAPFVYDVLLGNAAQFGWILTLQGLGGLVGSLFIGRFAKHMSASSLFGLGSVVSGVLLLLVFQSGSVIHVMGMSLFLGIVSVGARVGMQTLMQVNTSDDNRGRVYGMGEMLGSALELLSVVFAGVAALHLGIVPTLLLAASVTLLAGVLALVLLREPKPASQGL